MHILVACLYAFVGYLNMKNYMEENTLFDPVFLIFLFSNLGIVWQLWAGGFNILAFLLLYRVGTIVWEKVEEHRAPTIEEKKSWFLREERRLRPRRNRALVHAVDNNDLPIVQEVPVTTAAGVGETYGAGETEAVMDA
mgnify:CR=1 FL=1